MSKQKENNSTFQKTLTDLGTQLKFIGTFGFGITGMYGFVQELLFGRYPSLSPEEITLIFLASLTYLGIATVDDIKKIREEVISRGLTKYLSETVGTLKDVENMALKVVNRAGFTISSMSELLGYVFLLVPVLDAFTRLTEDQGFDIVTLGTYLKGAIVSVGIFHTRNIFTKLLNKLTNIKKKDSIEENFITDLNVLLIESKKWDRKANQATRLVVKDILSVIKKLDTREDYFILPDDISGIDGDIYDFGDFEFNVDLNIVIDSSQSLPFKVDANVGGVYDDNIEIVLSLNNDFSEIDYEDLLMLLNDYLRHEIEHILQLIDPDRPEITDKEGLTPFEYYTQSDEIGAQRAGFKRRAELEGKEVYDVVNNYIEYRQHIDKLSQDEKIELSRKLTETDEKKRVNQDVVVGDVVELLHMEDDWNLIPVMTRGVIMDIMDDPVSGYQLLVRWVIDPEIPEFKNVPLLPDVDIWRKITTERDRLNEQERKVPRVKTFFEDDRYKYVLPIGRGSLCELGKNTKWCIKNSDGKTFLNRVSIGAAGLEIIEEDKVIYVLIDKKNNETFLFIDDEKVPGLPTSNVRIWDGENRHIDKKKFLSDKPELHEMFELEYSIIDRIKYDMPISDEVLEKYSHENAFANAVYKIIKDPSEENISNLTEFMGEIYQHDDSHYTVENTISLEKGGIRIYIDEDDLKEHYLGLDDDDNWYWSIVERNYYDNYCEELDYTEERNYLHNYITDENWTKMETMLHIFGELQGGKTVESLDITNTDNELNELLTRIVPKEWDETADEMIYTMGCAIGEERLKSLREGLEDAMVFPYEWESSDIYRVDVSYEQLLYLIGENHMTNLSDIEYNKINEIGFSLSELWYESWDFGDEAVDEMNNSFSSFIDKVMEDYEDIIDEVVKNNKRFIETMDSLGFKKSGKWRSMYQYTNEAEYKYVDIEEYDSKTDMVEFRVRSEEGGHNTKRYKVKLDQLSDYVVSEEIFQ